MSAPIDSLQIGMHWFNERPGGLDRMFAALIDTLPAQGVNVRGMVAGSPAVFDASGGSVLAFAGAQAPLGARLWGSRRQSRALR
ncbi:MAG TPA: glycosyltransferase family 1 protein, partial [Paraburkholderia sp.]|nr:glycosyltransferase family 1 protein [Paraburkholderia sp.]